MKLWIDKVWSRRPGGLLKKPALLVWDHFRDHRTDLAKRKVKQLKTQLAVIPGGLTCQLQPLDVSVNKSFKGFMKKLNKWMQSSDFEVTFIERRKRTTITHVCEWVKKIHGMQEKRKK